MFNFFSKKNKNLKKGNFSFINFKFVKITRNLLISVLVIICLANIFSLDWKKVFNILDIRDVQSQSISLITNGLVLHLDASNIKALYDDFSENPLNSDIWETFGEEHGSISIDNGELTISQTAGGTGINLIGIASKAKFPVGSIYRAKVKNTSGRHAAVIGFGQAPWPNYPHGGNNIGLTWYSRADNISSVISYCDENISKGSFNDITQDLRDYQIIEFHRIDETKVEIYRNQVLEKTINNLKWEDDYSFYISLDGHTRPHTVVVDWVEVINNEDGGTISQWNDLSGQSNHAIQETPANQPVYKTNILNDKPVVRFDGNSKYLAGDNLGITGSSPSTAFIVTRRNLMNQPANTGVFSYGSSTGSGGTVRRYSIDTDGLGVRFNNGNRIFTGLTNTSDFFIQTHLHSSGANYGQHELYVNGEWQSQLSSGSPSNVPDIGNNEYLVAVGRATNGNIPIGNYFSGDIAEIIIYDRYLSDPEREEVEQYLGEKWLGWELEKTTLEDSNIRGEAYTDQEDFIYFNCLDEPSGSFPYTFTFPLGGNPCEIYHQGLAGLVNNYGVHLDYNTYTFEGYALHEKHGLISFRNGIPDDENYDFVNSCSETSSTDCNADNDCSACYDGGYDYETGTNRSQRVFGWAYIVKSHEWIKLDSDEVTGDENKFKILDFTHSDAGDFTGLFYHEDWGMIDLNCERPSYNCSPSYKVYVGHLEVAEMSAPHWGANQACSDASTALGAFLRWQIHGGNVSQFNIRVIEAPCGTETECFNSASVNEINIPSEHPDFGQGNQLKLGDHFNLDWDTSYKWWLQLEDHSELTPTSTPWIQFDHGDNPINEVQGVLSEDNIETNENSDFGDNYTFTTYKHEWPRPYFTWEGYPSREFQAGLGNRFNVIEKDIDEKTHYRDLDNNKVWFGNLNFIEDFTWWGQPEDKITIVNVYDLPDIGDPVLHLDADSIEDLEDGDRVEQWNDLSGSENNAIQSDENYMPTYKINALNGRPVISFSGGSWGNGDFFNIPNALDIFRNVSGSTIFTVQKYESSVSTRQDIIFLNTASGGASTRVSHGGRGDGYNIAGRRLDDDSFRNIILGDVDIGDFLLQASVIDHSNDSAEIFVNSDSQGSSAFRGTGNTSDTNSVNAYIGKSGSLLSNHFHGEIAEIIIYDRALSSNERLEIESYLAKKWGMEYVESSTDSIVDVYFESIEDNQRVWLSLTDPSNYTCATSTPTLDVSFQLPLWREIRAREDQQ